MITPINLPEHGLHAQGSVAALECRSMFYKPDPAPRMRKHQLPAIRLSRSQCARLLDWFDGYDFPDNEDHDLAFHLKLAADGGE